LQLARPAQTSNSLESITRLAVSERFSGAFQSSPGFGEKRSFFVFISLDPERLTVEFSLRELCSSNTQALQLSGEGEYALIAHPSSDRELL
jgi:hypothetical protein